MTTAEGDPVPSLPDSGTIFLSSVMRLKPNRGQVFIAEPVTPIHMSYHVRTDQKRGQVEAHPALGKRELF
jgi:hypothetical protein